MFKELLNLDVAEEKLYKKMMKNDSSLAKPKDEKKKEEQNDLLWKIAVAYMDCQDKALQDEMEEELKHVKQKIKNNGINIIESGGFDNFMQELKEADSDKKFFIEDRLIQLYIIADKARRRISKVCIENIDLFNTLETFNRFKEAETNDADYKNLEQKMFLLFSIFSYTGKNSEREDNSLNENVVEKRNELLAEIGGVILEKNKDLYDEIKDKAYEVNQIAVETSSKVAEQMVKESIEKEKMILQKKKEAKQNNNGGMYGFDEKKVIKQELANEKKNYASKKKSLDLITELVSTDIGVDKRWYLKNEKKLIMIYQVLLRYVENHHNQECIEAVYKDAIYYIILKHISNQMEYLVKYCVYDVFNIHDRLYEVRAYAMEYFLKEIKAYKYTNTSQFSTYLSAKELEFAREFGVSSGLIKKSDFDYYGKFLSRKKELELKLKQEAEENGEADYRKLENIRYICLEYKPKDTLDLEKINSIITQYFGKVSTNYNNQEEDEKIPAYEYLKGKEKAEEFQAEDQRGTIFATYENKKGVLSEDTIAEKIVRYLMEEKLREFYDSLNETELNIFDKYSRFEMNPDQLEMLHKEYIEKVKNKEQRDKEKKHAIENMFKDGIGESAFDESKFLHINRELINDYYQKMGEIIDELKQKIKEYGSQYKELNQIKIEEISLKKIVEYERNYDYKAKKLKLSKQNEHKVSSDFDDELLENFKHNQNEKIQNGTDEFVQLLEGAIVDDLEDLANYDINDGSISELVSKIEESFEDTIKFSDYIKAYINYYRKSNGKEPLESSDDYWRYLEDVFEDSGVPFTRTTAPNYYIINQRGDIQTDDKMATFDLVIGEGRRRKVIFALALAFKMDVRQLSLLLRKACREHDLDYKNPDEVLLYYCLKKNISYNQLESFYIGDNDLSQRFEEAKNLFFHSTRTLSTLEAKERLDRIIDTPHIIGGGKDEYDDLFQYISNIQRASTRSFQRNIIKLYRKVLFKYRLEETVTVEEKSELMDRYDSEINNEKVLTEDELKGVLNYFRYRIVKQKPKDKKMVYKVPSKGKVSFEWGLLDKVSFNIENLKKYQEGERVPPRSLVLLLILASNKYVKMSENEDIEEYTKRKLERFKTDAAVILEKFNYQPIYLPCIIDSLVVLSVLNRYPINAIRVILKDFNN